MREPSGWIVFLTGTIVSVHDRGSNREQSLLVFAVGRGRVGEGWIGGVGRHLGTRDKRWFPLLWPVTEQSSNKCTLAYSLSIRTRSEWPYSDVGGRNVIRFLWRVLENFCLRCLCDTWMNFLSLSFTVCVRASLCHLSFLPLFLLVYFWSSVRTLRQSFSRSENLTSDWTRPVCHTSQVGRGGDRSRSNVVCVREMGWESKYGVGGGHHFQSSALRLWTANPTDTRPCKDYLEVNTTR